MSNVENVIYKEKVVFKALEELDEILASKKVKPFELNVIGGFAMLLENIRLSDYTDIDYIGKDLPNEIKEIIDDIGLRYGLGRGWINNDVLMSGNTLEDLEFITGKLEFETKEKFRVITINSLRLECILRMKIIAIDTSFCGFELGGDFSRVKDFEDVALLMEHLKLSYNDMVEETFDYVECPEIYYLIRYYLRTRNSTQFVNYQNCKKIIKAKGKENI